MLDSWLVPPAMDSLQMDGIDSIDSMHTTGLDNVQAAVELFNGELLNLLEDPQNPVTPLEPRSHQFDHWEGLSELQQFFYSNQGQDGSLGSLGSLDSQLDADQDGQREAQDGQVEEYDWDTEDDDFNHVSIKQEELNSLWAQPPLLQQPPSGIPPMPTIQSAEIKPDISDLEDLEDLEEEDDDGSGEFTPHNRLNGASRNHSRAPSLSRSHSSTSRKASPTGHSPSTCLAPARLQGVSLWEPIASSHSQSTLSSLRRTEVPAVPDDPSIKPYGCNYPSCCPEGQHIAYEETEGWEGEGNLDPELEQEEREDQDPAGSDEEYRDDPAHSSASSSHPVVFKRVRKRKRSGSVVGSDSSFRTIRELREHCTRHKRSGQLPGEAPFRCALDPCGKTFKSAAGLLWHFTNASAGHFFVSMEEGETKPSKKFKQIIEPNGRTEMCPIPGCRKAFKQVAGLAYHLSHAKAHPEQVTEALLAGFSTKLQNKVRWWFTRMGMLIPGNFGIDEDAEATDLESS